MIPNTSKTVRVGPGDALKSEDAIKSGSGITNVRVPVSRWGAHGSEMTSTWVGWPDALVEKTVPSNDTPTQMDTAGKWTHISL